MALLHDTIWLGEQSGLVGAYAQRSAFVALKQQVWRQQPVLLERVRPPVMPPTAASLSFNINAGEHVLKALAPLCKRLSKDKQTDIHDVLQGLHTSSRHTAFTTWPLQ